MCGRGGSCKGIWQLCVPLEKFFAILIIIIIIIIIEITKKVDYAVCTFLTMYLVAIIPHVNSFMSYRGLAASALWNEVLQENSGRKSVSASAL